MHSLIVNAMPSEKRDSMQSATTLHTEVCILCAWRFTGLLGLVGFASILDMNREANYVNYSSCVVSPRKTPRFT